MPGCSAHSKGQPEPTQLALGRCVATVSAPEVPHARAVLRRRCVVAAYPSSLVDDSKVPQCLSCYGILTEVQARDTYGCRPWRIWVARPGAYGLQALIPTLT